MAIDRSNAPKRPAAPSKGRGPAAKPVQGVVRPPRGPKPVAVAPVVPPVAMAPQAVGPRRTCVGCRKEDSPEEMCRVVTGPDGDLCVDPSATRGGRGAWVHPTRACVKAMVQRHAAERTLKVPAQRTLDSAVILGYLAAALRQKITSLVQVAARTRSLIVGAESVADALERERIPLAVVARDAGANTRELAEDAAQMGPGPAVRTYGTKETLGAWLDRDEVAVLAVSDFRIAAELVASFDRLAGVEE